MRKWVGIMLLVFWSVALASADSFALDTNPITLEELKEYAASSLGFNQPDLPFEVNVRVKEFLLLEVEKVESLEGGALAKIIPDLNHESNKLVVKLLITQNGLNNNLVIVEQLSRLKHIGSVHPESGTKLFSHPYIWAETHANALAGSLVAKERIAMMDLEIAKNLTNEINQYPQLISKPELIKEYSEARLKDAEAFYSKVNKEAKLDLKKRQEAWNERKKSFDELEKAPKKFNDFVIANDRVGVKKMLEAYLPWELMEPSEQNAWKKWLNAMVSPRQENKIVVFRGIDGDALLKGSKSGEPGLLSTILSKNQGSYTRRLRSLTTMRDRFGSTHFGKLTGHNPSLLQMMFNQAVDPQGSPFLSVSNHTIAKGFGKKRMVALNIDQDRVLTNVMAGNYISEKERLIPLVVFPDEVLHSSMELTPESEAAFLKNVEIKLGRNLTDQELAGDVKGKYIDVDMIKVGDRKIGSNSGFLKQGFVEIKDLFLDASSFPNITDACILNNENCNCAFAALDSLLDQSSP
jgi:hypothetical protein